MKVMQILQGQESHLVATTAKYGQYEQMSGGQVTGDITDAVDQINSPAPDS